MLKRFLTISALLSAPAFAHPVIYKGGWVYSGSFMPASNVQRVSYSFHPNFSAELSSDYYRVIDRYRDYRLGVNALVKRWFFEDFQANIYASVHGGYYTQTATRGVTFHPQIEFDWESRELYAATKASLYYFNQRVLYKVGQRLGFAPYVAGMDTLQTWLMVDFEYFKEEANKLKVTPLMRFFYKNVLWEIGSDIEGDFFLTLMVHY